MMLMMLCSDVELMVLCSVADLVLCRVYRA